MRSGACTRPKSSRRFTFRDAATVRLFADLRHPCVRHFPCPLIVVRTEGSRPRMFQRHAWIIPLLHHMRLDVSDHHFLTFSQCFGVASYIHFRFRGACVSGAPESSPCNTSKLPVNGNMGASPCLEVVCIAVRAHLSMHVWHVQAVSILSIVTTRLLSF